MSEQTIQIKDQSGNNLYPATTGEAISVMGQMLPTFLSALDSQIKVILRSYVTGVKGNSESVYRVGNVNLTPANIGLGNVTNESKEIMFTSPHFTGTPTVPTQSEGDNTTAIANTGFVTRAVSAEAVIRANAVRVLTHAVETMSSTVTALTGLQATNWGGFSVESTESAAITAISQAYIDAGFTSPEVAWFLVGTSLSSLKAYQYNGSGNPVLVSDAVYDYTSFSTLSSRTEMFKGTLSSISEADALTTAASNGVYYLNSSTWNGFLMVGYDSVNSKMVQQMMSNVRQSLSA